LALQTFLMIQQLQIKMNKIYFWIKLISTCLGPAYVQVIFHLLLSLKLMGLSIMKILAQLIIVQFAHGELTTLAALKDDVHVPT
jgi:hypothetical protein